ncbi:MAG TPA: response regulator transcription factor [Bacteroidota bacterium]|nr:response regulator transcription factor [Bacteroidota bacterium]
MSVIRVAIVEDMKPVRESFQNTINRTEGFSCEHAFEDAETALQQLASITPDVMLVDIELPRMSGIEFVRTAKLRGDSPRTEFVMCTVFEDADKIFNSLVAGATGYLLKTLSPQQLIEAIREVHNGGAPMSMQIARKVVTHFSAPQPEAAVLSKREREVIDLLARGFLYKEIADRLGISQGTVHAHIHTIYEKLHVSNRTEAVNKVYPRRHGGQ